MYFNSEKMGQRDGDDVYRIMMQGIMPNPVDEQPTAYYAVQEGKGHVDIDIADSEPQSRKVETGDRFTVPRGALARITGQMTIEATYKSEA